ncbi:MAG: hypothetical protein E6R05_00965 [Candidatus Moraniibacteriota bacterium]|nr:MAG: hypothetical protein E6R05_00965 [Candidatus Moranbacteria bacterium]
MSKEMGGKALYEDSLSPLYRELENISFPNPVFDKNRVAIKVPSTKHESIVFSEIADLLKATFVKMNHDEKMEYLGFVHVEPGEYYRGTENPTPDKRAGARYQSTPKRQGEVGYGFYISKTIVPNILYELGISDMGGYQVRTIQSPTHFHPAVNLMQGNAVTMLEWLSRISNLKLRLPTEREWELSAYSISKGEEFLHKQARGKGNAHLFDPTDYTTHLVHDSCYSKGDNGVLMGGNVWEMTTPSLEIDFVRLPPRDTGAIWGGTIYNAKGGGFQHCSYSPRLATEMACDVTLRSPSLGFRMVAEDRSQKFWKGWSERTRSFKGGILHNGERYVVEDSSLHYVQTGNTEGLAILVNGEKIKVAINNTKRVDSLHRSTELYNDSGVFVGQVEHILAALAGLNIWNAIAIIDGAPAAPVADYSFLPFVALLQQASFDIGSSRILRIKERIEIGSKGSRCILEPGRSVIDVRIDFSRINSAIGIQTASFKPGLDSFATEIAPARTFIRSSVDLTAWNDIRVISLRGLPEYSRIEESPLPVAVRGKWVTKMRFDNEPARHKLGDVIGDLALLNMPIAGKIYVDKPGHQFNMYVVKRLSEMLDKKDDRLRVVSV